MGYLQDKLLAGKRIFVVEDDIVNASVFYRCLSSQGALIYEDVLGYGIVEHIAQSLPLDVIIMDIQLRREKNGYEVFEQLKLRPELQNIPVVAISSLDAESQIPKARNAGFAGYISKPVNAIELPGQIARVINGEHLWIVSR